MTPFAQQACDVAQGDGGRRNGGDRVDVARQCFGIGQLELRCLGTLHADPQTGTHDEQIGAELVVVAGHIAACHISPRRS